MLKPAYTGSFLKDLKLMERRCKNLAELETVTTLIVNEQPLPAQCPPTSFMERNRRESGNAMSQTIGSWSTK
jgi:hypothetical protein